VSAPVENNGASLANIGIEKAVLGSLINGGRSLIDNLGVPAIDPNFFYHSQPSKILGAITELYDEGAPIDLQIVTERLRQQGNLEAAGGAAAITTLGVDGNPDADIARYNLGELRALYAKRRATRVADRLKRGDIDLDSARTAIDEIINRSRAKKSWTDALNAAVVTSSELHKLELVPRKKLLGDWFCEGDLGFIFAFRGVGKTWLALAIAQALSTGDKLGDWQAHAPVKVLYADGEMPADLMRDRCKGLEASNANLEFLNHEILFERTGRVLNIANPEVQQAITGRCVITRSKVLILDNLSTLASGMKENEADSWELVNNWLLDLRRRKIAVVIVHHAGRSGEMRGTSKREDNVFWIIALDDAKKNADEKRGAQFVSRFTKPSRNTQDEVPAYEWHFVTDQATGLVSVEHKQAQTMEVFLGLIGDGVRECNQIAQEMKTSPATISRLAKRAIDTGKIIKKSREYFLAEGQKIDKKS
jgi:putative DNA primase/helicase